MGGEVTLDMAAENAAWKVTRLLGTGTIIQRILQMGITPGAHIQVLRRAPLADPIEIKVRGAQFALRRDECKNIAVVRAQ